MSLRFHEIAEANHRIQNPFSEEKLMLLGEICRLHRGMRILDLACGKGELLCRWAHDHGISGVGVDISPVFIGSAKARAYELGVTAQVSFVIDDAAHYPSEHHEYNIVSCLGATWIGHGLVGTIEMMRVALKEKRGLLLVGEPFWLDEPPEPAWEIFGIQKDTFATLAGTLDRFESTGAELVEMVLADQDSWDRYEAQQWATVVQWLKENPTDRDAEAMRQWLRKNRRSYLQYGRRYMGWGVFVLRVHEPA